MLTLQSICYCVDGKEIVKDVSFSLDKGEHLLIHGTSGCGKSTLMHIMAGLLKPTSGSIVFNGMDYKSLSDTEMDTLRGENFGFVFQKMHLIGHLTARQNIALVNGKGIEDEIINDLGIKGILDQKASSLSVGEAQRVALARAIAHKPSIIFADEPTSALDSNNADKVMEILTAQAEKYDACLVITSHDDRIVTRFKNKLDLSHD